MPSAKGTLTLQVIPDQFRDDVDFIGNHATFLLGLKRICKISRMHTDKRHPHPCPACG